MLIRKLMLYHTQTKLQYRNRALIHSFIHYFHFILSTHLSTFINLSHTSHHITIVLRRTTSTNIIYFLHL